MSGRPALFALLTAVALVVGGCASGGRTPTNVARDLGPCPSLPPTTSLTKLNARLQGLARSLVPIAAVRVRGCEYAATALRPFGTFMLPNSLAAQFEGKTNRLRAGSLAVSCFADAPTDFLTFASDSQQVIVDESCGALTNGVFSAVPTQQWFNELQRYTSSTGPAQAVGAGHPTGYG
jgi:hypothetical protein